MWQIKIIITIFSKFFVVFEVIIIQALFCFYVGYILHRLIYLNFKSRNYEFDKYNDGEPLNFMFRMCNRECFEIYSLYILPIYSPLIIIGANRFVYDVIFVITMCYATMYYSNNEVINFQMNSFRKLIKLDSIDY